MEWVATKEIHENENEDSALVTVEESPTISLHALMGKTNVGCLRTVGFVNNKNIQFLIDGGSSHSFIQEKVVKYLGLHITSSDQFTVFVGNGETLSCVGKCENVSFEIQGHTFVIDFFVINLHGADTILGVSWQKGFGELKINYQQSYIKFFSQGKEICLQGSSAVVSEQISRSKMAKLFKHSSVNSCFLLKLVPSVAAVDYRGSTIPWVIQPLGH